MPQWDISESTGEDVNWIESQLNKFNSKKLSCPVEQLKRIEKGYIVKDDGVIIAGIFGRFSFKEILYVGLLFVADNYRKQGLGSTLLRKIEDTGKELGAKISHLVTLDFQAKGFYLKQGYEIFATLKACPKDHDYYFLKKELVMK